MTFVSEKIPQNILKSFDFSMFKRFDGTPMRVDSMLEWTRDEDRDAFLIATEAGGGAHVGSPRQVRFGFWWKGDVVHFQGNEVDSQDEEGWITTWDKASLDISSFLLSKRGGFVALLKEALIAKGARLFANPDYNNRVIVKLD